MKIIAQTMKNGSVKVLETPDPITSQLATTLTTLKILESLASGKTQTVDLSEIWNPSE